MKRNSSFRAWEFLGVTAALFAATLAAARRFPPAPPEPASVELRARLDSLKAFDAAALEKVCRRRELAGAAALSAVRASEIQAQLSRAWDTKAFPAQFVGDLTNCQLTLCRAGVTEWPRLLGDVSQVQQLAGVSVSAVSVSARGRVLSVELTARIVAHTQPADDKASGLPAVVRTPKIR